MSVTISGTAGISTPPVVVQGSTSGGITLAAPAVAGTNTQTLVAASGTLAPLIAGTAVASTSGTSIDFTGIPSWVKRITIMFNGISLNASSSYLIQIGSGSFVTTGYSGAMTLVGASVATQGVNFSGGVQIYGAGAGNISTGNIQITLFTGNTWNFSGTYALNNIPYSGSVGGYLALSGTLDRVRITTVNGTDTFDAGTINIMYE